MSLSQQRKKGVTYSALFHLFLLMLAVFGLPVILSPNIPPEPQAITVDLLPISALSNVKPSEPKPEPKKPEPPKEKEQKKPSPPVKTATAPPPPPEKPAEVKTPKKEEPKKEPQKKPEDKKDDKKTKPKEDDLAAILKAVRETAQKEKQDKQKAAQDQKAQTPAKSDRYDETMPLSLSERDAIRNQIAACWNVPAGAKDAQDLVIVLHITLNQDGSLVSAELASASIGRYNSDSFFRAAADSAIRAVRQCSPLKNLSPEKYGTWRDMELTFNPKDMLL
jgi:outer membrane biosynthesis protein TonB